MQSLLQAKVNIIRNTVKLLRILLIIMKYLYDLFVIKQTKYVICHTSNKTHLMYPFITNQIV